MPRPLRPALAGSALLLLAACVSPPEAPAVASVTAPDGTVFPVTAGPRGWEMRIDGKRVPCPRPETDSCHWAMRAHLAAEAALDDATG